MGTFDTIVIDGKRYQTKALGSGMSTFTVGDSVRLVYKSFTEEEYMMSPAHKYLDQPLDYSILATPEYSGWDGSEILDDVSVLIIDGKISGLGTHPDNQFDKHGHSVGKVVWDPVFEVDEFWQRLHHPPFGRPRRG